jgi:hypothetical protein
VWKQLNHPNVLTFLGVDTETFASTNYLCMVSPWMTNGTLSQYMTSAGYAPEYDSPRVVRADHRCYVTGPFRSSPAPSSTKWRLA